MKYICLALISLICFGCSKKAAETSYENPLEVRLAYGADITPEATVFKMSGDYADHVAVTLNADGSLAYYPAITDVSPASVPVKLADGWWLNRQGLSASSVFTRWTFSEYAALPSQPSRAEIIDAIIPGARVTAFRKLPLPLSDALADPSLCLPLLK